MSSRSSSPEIEGAIGGEEAQNSAVDSVNLAEKMTTNGAASTTWDSFYHNNKQDLMYELRQIRHGEKPVTGQEHRDKINNFLSKRLQVQAQTEGKDNVPANVDNVEEHRPEAIVVEVEGLYERRPVSSLLHSNAFRRQLDNIIRRGVSGLSFSPQSRSSSRVSVSPVPNTPAPRPPPVTPAQEVRLGHLSAQPQRHVLPPAPSLPHRRQDQAQSDVQEQQNVQDVPDSRPDDIPSPQASYFDQLRPPQAPYFEQLRPSQEDTFEIQRETIIHEISELVHQGLVSSSLEGGFRGTLEVLMEGRLGITGNNGERVRDLIHSLPRDPLHRRNDFSNLGLPVDDDLDNISVTTVSASAVPYTQTNLHLRREVASLRVEVTEMKNMLKMNLELQLDIQRAVRQEVAAAVSQKTGDESRNMPSSSGERRYRPVNEAECLICLENPVNSVLYQCGHMCVCYCCGKHLIHQGAKCPICRAPIKDIIQAFSCNGK